MNNGLRNSSYNSQNYVNEWTAFANVCLNNSSSNTSLTRDVEHHCVLRLEQDRHKMAWRIFCGLVAFDHWFQPSERHQQGYFE
jgi:hypothetical protein